VNRALQGRKDGQMRWKILLGIIVFNTRTLRVVFRRAAQQARDSLDPPLMQMTATEMLKGHQSRTTA